MPIPPNRYANAALNAWINCENLLMDIQEIRNYLSHKVIHTLRECAHISLGTFHALKTGSVNSLNMALLCVGICEECAELCERHYSSSFQDCAKICRDTADKLSDLAFSA